MIRRDDSSEKEPVSESPSVRSVGSGGSHNGKVPIRAKLSDAQVEEIRDLYAAGGHSQKELSRMYGVGTSQISRIVNLRQRV